MSAPDRALQRFGTIVVCGGGCYGSYYVRQLGRAAAAGAAAWDRLLVVDRDPACTVARAAAAEVIVADWGSFFAAWLGEAARDPAARAGDAIVPSPLMPHLMFDWLADRARGRWPARRVERRPMPHPPATPWQRSAPDGTHYASFAEWMCPINCIEPARCPHTRGPRDWSMPVALRAHAEALRADDRTVAPAVVLHCAHRVYGVGMIAVPDVLGGDAVVAAAGTRGAARVLISTASHCHGAVAMLEIGEPVDAGRAGAIHAA